MQSSANQPHTAIDAAGPPISYSPHAAGWMALLLAGPLLLLLLKLVPSLDQPILRHAGVHVISVGSAALVGVVLAVLVLRVALRAEDGRVLLIGLGFLATASIFLVHAISTPGVLLEGRGTAASWSTQISLVAGSIFFAFSGMALTPATNQRIMRLAWLWIGLLLVGWLAYCYVFLVAIPAAEAQAAIPPDPYGYDIPRPGTGSEITAMLNTIGPLLATLGFVCYTLAIWRHTLLYRRAPSPAGLATISGIVLFGESLVTQTLWTPFAPSFWLSHVQELFGFLVIAIAILVSYQRGQSVSGLLENLFLAGTRTRLQARYAAALDGLVETLARGEQPSPALRSMLLNRIGLSGTQLAVFERAASAVAQERQQRQELERLNQALRQSEQAKTELTQMIVHDLKTPLTGMLGFLDLLRASDLSDEQRDMLSYAVRSARNLNGLVSDLLDVAQMEEGKLTLARQQVPAHSLLSACVAELQVWLEQSGKTAVVDAPRDLLIDADPRLMQRVVLNLLSNAIKHTPEGTTVTLRAAQAPFGSLIEIADDGPGIPPERLVRIFERFAHGPGTQNSTQRNTGLGLTFCKLAVEAHGGSIAVNSAPGIGTTFRVLLP